MIKKHVTGRVAVFVDAANILYSQQTLGWEIDYAKLLNYLKSETEIVSANFYSGKISKNQKQVDFFNKMQSFGYQVITKEVKWIKDRGGKILKGKGNLDIELALDVAQAIESFDTLVLMSGDSDFAVLVDLVRSKNKKVVVISTKYHISKELIEKANKYINLKFLKDQIRREVPIKSKNPA